MIDDIALNKTAIIRRCLSRIAEEYRDDPSRLEDFTTQDAIVLNMLRACEASIDLAMHRIAIGKLGVPQSSRDAFEILMRNQLLAESTGNSMKNMVGFRNIAVHCYEKLQRPILEAIISRHLTDFEDFLEELFPAPES